MKKLLVIASIAGCGLVYACGGGEHKPIAGTEPDSQSAKAKADYDPDRGAGKFTTVDLGAKLNQAMAASGEKLAGVKCLSCHKVTEEKLVGPGWKGVSQRHKPEWIMNFLTNTDEMISKDPKVQAQLEICMVRMPNQSLTDEDARSLLEFMRKNDGVK